MFSCPVVHSNCKFYHQLGASAGAASKVSDNDIPTVSCGNIITDSDGDNSGLWCVANKAKCVSCSHMKPDWLC